MSVASAASSSSRTVVIVEDDDSLRDVLVVLLEGEGFEVHAHSTGESALESEDWFGVAAVVLDLRLPGMHGFEVLRELRNRSAVPVLILSAQADSHDVVVGLEMGADDYLTKPFVPRELVARLRALMRRAFSSPTSQVVRVGDVDIDIPKGEVRRGGEVLSLSRTEILLLFELAADSGRVLSRSDLLSRVWGYEFGGDPRLVDTVVYRLRTKLEANPAEPTIVLTVRGLGYRLADR